MRANASGITPSASGSGVVASCVNGSSARHVTPVTHDAAVAARTRLLSAQCSGHVLVVHEVESVQHEPAPLFAQCGLALLQQIARRDAFNLTEAPHVTHSVSNCAHVRARIAASTAASSTLLVGERLEEHFGRGCARVNVRFVDVSVRHAHACVCACVREQSTTPHTTIRSSYLALMNVSRVARSAVALGLLAAAAGNAS
jgi:hypothetical protein